MTRASFSLTGPAPNPPAVLLLVGVTSLVEIVLLLADSGLVRGLIGGADLRQFALVYGAFWRGLLLAWEPAFPGQSVTMFLTYAALHGGLMHLVGNMVVVLALGRVAVARLGQGGFLLLYALSSIGGAAGFAALSDSLSPMVGASGAVFGLIGAWQFWEFQSRRAVGAPLGQIGRTIAALVLVNVVMWWFLDGFLAWEAHLGGFVTGWLWAALATPRR
jgi:membrane associated rhomboid family serine protease